jgi:hypothetical protein
MRHQPGPSLDEDAGNPDVIGRAGSLRAMGMVKCPQTLECQRRLAQRPVRGGDSCILRCQEVGQRQTVVRRAGFRLEPRSGQGCVTGRGVARAHSVSLAVYYATASRAALTMWRRCLGPGLLRWDVRFRSTAAASTRAVRGASKRGAQEALPCHESGALAAISA